MRRACSLLVVLVALAAVLLHTTRADAAQGLSLRSGSQPSTLLLTADPTGGDVALTGLNATVRVSCALAACAAISGDGTASLTISPPAISEMTLTLTPIASGQPAGVRATQRGTTVQVSLGSSQTTTTTSSSGSTEFRSSGGFMLFVFAGGDVASLARAVVCGSLSPTFWATSADGSFLTYVPFTAISVVNEAFLRAFPNGLAAQTPLVARCS